MLNSDNYDKIPIEVYKEIYAEAKEKFNETLVQSEIITGRAVQISIGIATLSGWAATSFSRIHHNFYLLLFLYLILLIWLSTETIDLFSKRLLPAKGTMPRSIYGTEDDLINPNFDTEKVFYFQQINRYQKKIDRLEENNKLRGEKLGRAIKLTFIFFFATVLLFVFRTAAS
jgi:hypothetical protein